MLQITVPATERFDEVTNTFIESREQKLTLEHSLISVSKWEAKWRKSFLSNKEPTQEELIDYVRCMTINNHVDDEAYLNIPPKLMQQILDYINSPMTATWFAEDNRPPSREIVTAELIYYWMISLNIPFECEKWHLNRLLTLVRVCGIKQAPAKNMSQRDIMSRNAALNAARRNSMHTKG